MTTNILVLEHPETQISKLLSIIGQPARIQILIVIGETEACVCHMEAVLGMRQASISQHLMVLRKASLVTTQRDGRNIFYRITHPAILQVLNQAAEISGITPDVLASLTHRPVSNCSCPQCNPDQDPRLTCLQAV